MGFALWLIPSRGKQHDVLSREIRELSITHKSSPFSPHATLVSGLECPDATALDQVWNDAANIVRAWKERRNAQGSEAVSLRVKLEDISTRGIFFQCVFLLLQKDPSLMSLHEEISAKLRQGNTPPYMPHISLLYKDLEVKEAQAVIDGLGQTGNFQREPYFSFHGMQDIDFDAIELWSCSGSVEEWRCVKTCSMAEM